MIALQRMPAFIAATATLLFIIALLHQQRDKIPVANPFRSTPGLSFYEIASKHGTDKVTTHSYHDMYEKYLPPLRSSPLKMLEIGLGCDMSYGPGASYYTWLEYFPHVDLWFMEYDANCAKQWANKTSSATVVPGDQADVPFLERFIKQSGGNFDVIIDDGGHTMNQQKTSLQHLFRIVKPGGLYFCEDLQTSYMAGYGGAEVAKEKGEKTMMQYIAEMNEDLTVPNPRRVEFEDVEKIVHIDCSREVCVFEKRREETLETTK